MPRWIQALFMTLLGGIGGAVAGAMAGGPTGLVLGAVAGVALCGVASTLVAR